MREEGGAKGGDPKIIHWLCCWTPRFISLPLKFLTVYLF